MYISNVIATVTPCFVHTVNVARGRVPDSSCQHCCMVLACSTAAVTVTVTVVMLLFYWCICTQ